MSWSWSEKLWWFTWFIWVALRRRFWDGPWARFCLASDVQWSDSSHDEIMICFWSYTRSATEVNASFSFFCAASSLLPRDKSVSAFISYLAAIPPVHESVIAILLFAWHIRPSLTLFHKFAGLRVKSCFVLFCEWSLFGWSNQFRYSLNWTSRELDKIERLEYILMYMLMPSAILVATWPHNSPSLLISFGHIVPM